MKGPRRLEIERRLLLFHANRPVVIARDLGVTVAYVNEVSARMKEANHAHPSPRPTTQEGNPKPLGEGR